jgi:putative GTP pyrophosphokinase
MISRRQVDLLGERLKAGPIVEADLRLLDEYRRQFEPAITHVMRELQERFGLQPAARPAKSTIAIVEKLQRETIRLSQMQDIAGCRLVVGGVSVQQALVNDLAQLYPNAIVVSRITEPSYGYRAVHIVLIADVGRLEIQVRTSLQHLWAQLSEAIASRLGSDIKYGRSNSPIVQLLVRLSEDVQSIEEAEAIINRGSIEGTDDVEFVRRFEANKLDLIAAFETVVADSDGWG